MVIIKNLIELLEIFLFAYLAFTAFYLLIFGIAGLFRRREVKAKSNRFRKIAVLVPGYKEDNVIVETARESLNQDYPKDLYDVFIIADSFRQESLDRLRKLDVQVIEVSFDKSSKAKALNRAMREIKDEYQVAVILDADNIMVPGFLRIVNEAFDLGYTAVQGHRTAKNTNTSFALLDAISEEINNHIFRQGHRVLGFSSALIGSGMAFDYYLFRKTMEKVTAHGEDKELEMHLLANGIKIGYLPDALVYDEKIQKAEVFAKQRRRWLSAQFEMFRKYAGKGLKLLVMKGNMDLFDKVVQMILLPRVLHLGIVTLLLLVAAFLTFIPGTQTFFSLSLQVYAGLCLVTLTALLVSVPGKYYSKATLKALKSLPGAFLIMFGLLFRLRGAGKSFIHTPHGTTETNKI